MGKQKRGPAKLPQGETVVSLKSKKGDKAAARQLLLWSLPLNACLDYPFWSLVHYLQSTDLSEFDEQTNRQKRHGKYMHGKYIYIYTICHFTWNTCKKPIQKNKALPFFTRFHLAGPKKNRWNFGGIFFSIKLLGGFIVGIGNSSTFSSTTISMLLVHPMAQPSWERDFRVAFSSRDFF